MSNVSFNVWIELHAYDGEVREGILYCHVCEEKKRSVRLCNIGGSICISINDGAFFVRYVT